MILFKLLKTKLRLWATLLTLLHLCINIFFFSFVCHHFLHAYLQLWNLVVRIVHEILLWTCQKTSDSFPATVALASAKRFRHCHIRAYIFASTYACVCVMLPRLWPRVALSSVKPCLTLCAFSVGSTGGSWLGASG